MKVIRGACHVFTWLCMIFIVAMMLLMVGEVLSRLVIQRSILGSTEWAQVLLLCNMASFGASILTNRQIKVNVLTSRFKAKTQVLIDIIVLILTVVVVSVLSWQQFNFAVSSFKQHVFYNNINLPQWPFVTVFAMSYGVAALTALLLVIRKIGSMISKKWDEEAALEELDELFVYGRKGVIAERTANRERGSETKGIGDEHGT